MRLSGEEPAGKSGRDAWAAADDLLLRKIAQAGLSGLSNMLNGTPDVDAGAWLRPRAAMARRSRVRIGPPHPPEGAFGVPPWAIPASKNTPE